MSLSTCVLCQQEFPADLVQPYFANGIGWRKVDAICALQDRNRMHGLPDGTPFAGTEANRLYEQTVRWVAKHRATTPPSAGR